MKSQHLHLLQVGLCISGGGLSSACAVAGGLGTAVGFKSCLWNFVVARNFVSQSFLKLQKVVSNLCFKKTSFNDPHWCRNPQGTRTPQFGKRVHSAERCRWQCLGYCGLCVAGLTSNRKGQRCGNLRAGKHFDVFERFSAASAVHLLGAPTNPETLSLEAPGSGVR